MTCTGQLTEDREYMYIFLDSLCQYTCTDTTGYTVQVRFFIVHESGVTFSCLPDPSTSNMRGQLCKQVFLLRRQHGQNFIFVDKFLGKFLGHIDHVDRSGRRPAVLAVFLSVLHDRFCRCKRSIQQIGWSDYNGRGHVAVHTVFF